MKPPLRSTLLATLALACVPLVLAPLPVRADERAELQALRDTTMQLIQLLVDQGVLPKARADAMIREAERRAAPSRDKPPAPAVASKPPPVRVPYVPQSVREEIRAQVKEDVMAEVQGNRWASPAQVPEWSRRFSFYGDLRLRAQQDRFGNSDPLLTPFLQASGLDINNTTEDQFRLRLRARVGFEARLADWVVAGARLTTGSANNPTSLNQTLGNTNRPYSAFFDLAYIRLQPREWLNISGGRIANPFFGTDLLWAPDLTFEGVQATARPKFGENATGFFTAGAFPIQYVESSATVSARSKWLYGAQAGAEWKSEGHGLRFGVAYYDFRDIEGVPNAVGSTGNNLTAPQFRTKGNTLYNINAIADPANPVFGLASQFRELNVTAAWDWQIAGPTHVITTLDYVTNLGFDASEIERRTRGIVTGLSKKARGYLARVQVGQPVIRAQGDWQAELAYKYLERDAVVDAFTDGDFRLGGTDAKGYILGFSYGIARNTWLRFRYLSANPISGPPLPIDVLQLDLNARF